MEVLANLNKRLIRFEKEKLGFEDGRYQSDSMLQRNLRAFRKRKVYTKVASKEIFVKLKRVQKKSKANGLKGNRFSKSRSHSI